MNLIKIQEVHIFYDYSLSPMLNKFHMLEYIYLVYKHNQLKEFGNINNIAKPILSYFTVMQVICHDPILL